MKQCGLPKTPLDKAVCTCCCVLQHHFASSIFRCLQNDYALESQPRPASTVWVVSQNLTRSIHVLPRHFRCFGPGRRRTIAVPVQTEEHCKKLLTLPEVWREPECHEWSPLTQLPNLLIWQAATRTLEAQLFGGIRRSGISELDHFPVSVRLPGRARSFRRSAGQLALSTLFSYGAEWYVRSVVLSQNLGHISILYRRSGVRSKSTSSGQEHEQAKGTVWFAVRDFCGAFLILDTFPRHMGTKIAWSSLPQLLPQKVQRTEWIQWIMQTAN